MIIADFIERWAVLEPGREALVVTETGKRWTYGELHEEVRRATGWMVSHGVGEGDRVALAAKNRVEHVAAFYACARLSAILVPVNWRLAAPEVAYVLEDSEPKVALTEAEFQAGHEGASCPVQVLGDAAPWADAEPHDGAGFDAWNPEQPVMILYTSGTTGRPKGALLTQGSVYANAVQTALSWDLSGADASLTHTPFFHTGGWNVLTNPLLHRGGKLVLTAAFDEHRTLELVGEEKLTILFAVPTMFERMRRSDRFASADFSSLRFMISGGAPCAEEIAEAFRERGVRFKQGYGLTEVGPNCFAISLDEAERRPGSVGVPVHGCRVRLVDEEGADVARGEVGEILLSGPHMCAGYWRKPEATAEAIRDGWFHTGDLGRQDQDGYLSIVGRRKEMFISGGENVYPAEVERALRTHPLVAEAAVVGVPHEEWGEVGCAFVIAAGDEAPEPAALKEHCQGLLARYKVPKHWKFVSDFPLTPSGKVARKQLEELARGA
jgi:fatty-acyl-CoA synthase